VTVQVCLEIGVEYIGDGNDDRLPIRPELRFATGSCNDLDCLDSQDVMQESSFLVNRLGSSQVKLHWTWCRSMTFTTVSEENYLLQTFFSVTDSDQMDTVWSDGDPKYRVYSSYQYPCLNAALLDVVNEFELRGSTVGTVVATTNDKGGGDTCSDADDIPAGVWYRLDPAPNETIELCVEALTTGFDPEILVFTGRCGRLECKRDVVLQNNSTCYQISRLDSETNPRLPYFVLVHGGSGDFRVY
jgi:hypothetical protein